jgi:hypothetical protein
MVYDYVDGKSGKRYIIWGLTAMMTKNFVETLKGGDISDLPFS